MQNPLALALQEEGFAEPSIAREIAASANELTPLRSGGSKSRQKPPLIPLYMLRSLGGKALDDLQIDAGCERHAMVNIRRL